MKRTENNKQKGLNKDFLEKKEANNPLADESQSDPKAPVGSGTDVTASGDLGKGAYNLAGGTTSGGLNTDSTEVGGAGVGSGAGDVSAIAGMGRSGALGSGADDIRTTVQPGDVSTPMQANPGMAEGVTGGGAGAAYPDRDPGELGAEPGQARNITPSGKVLDPDKDDQER